MPHSGWRLNLNKPTEGGLLQNCWGGDWDALMDGKAAALYLLSPTCLMVRGVSVVCTFIPDRCSFSFIQKSLFWRLTPPSTQSCWCHHLTTVFFPSFLEEIGTGFRVLFFTPFPSTLPSTSRMVHPVQSLCFYFSNPDLYLLTPQSMSAPAGIIWNCLSSEILI